MTITYVQAAFPTFQLVYPQSAIPTLIGKPMALCRMFTYKSIAHTTAKATFTSNIGNPPPAQTNPIVLDGNGQATVYWAIDDADPTDLYYVVVMGQVGDDTVYYAWDDFNGSPLSGGSTPSTVTLDTNLARNPQFEIWEHMPVNFPGGTVLNVSNFDTTADDVICDDWFFFKDGTTAIDSISRQSFVTGQTDVPANPTYYLRYSCTVAGTTETKKNFSQWFKDVQFLNGERISFSFWAKADTASRNMVVTLKQDFGTGGGQSSVVETTLGTFNLTTAWVQYKVENFLVPSIQSKTIGANNDSLVKILFNLDVNTVSTYDLCNVQLEIGTVVTDFQQDTYEGYKSRLSDYFKIPTSKTDILMDVFILTYFGSPLSGYLPLQDQTIARPQALAGTLKKWAAYNLYCTIWTSFADAQAPVSTGRGASAVADWNAGKTINLPLTMCRLIGNDGTGATLTARVPGVTGGAETYTQLATDVAAHVHAFTGKVPSSNGSGFQVLMQGATSGTDHYFPSGNSGDTVNTLTATNANVRTTAMPIMNPFSFLPFYIHL